MEAEEVFMAPEKYSILAGKGDSECIEIAERCAIFNSGLGNVNVVEIDGVLPPRCKFASRLPAIPAGSIIPAVCAKISSIIPGDIIAAAVGVGIPIDEKETGVIVSFTGYCTADAATEKLEKTIHKLFDNGNRILGDIRIRSIDHKIICCGALVAACPLLEL